MYYNDVMVLRRITFGEIAPVGAAFHAVQTSFQAGRQTEANPHCHDFYEWMLVREGEARHPINGVDTSLRPGQLWLIRPDDEHAIYITSKEGIEFINIAFPCEVYNDFVSATGLQEISMAWTGSEMPVCLDLTSDQMRSLWVEATAAVRSFHYKPTRLAFGKFWNAAAEASTLHHVQGLKELPMWLRGALTWAQKVDVEELTLDGLVEVAGMSFGHLSRTLRACKGVTPTELITDLRLQRAAYELATTDKGITEIAFDCGFNNLSYFYRRFQQFHRKSPRRYREEIKRSLPE
jgi:AraC family cel operon transcriptional repressor